MDGYKEFFKGKKITVMRIGLLGRGVQDAAFLAECGAEILVVDDAPQSVMQPSVDALKDYPNISFKFGPYDLQDFRHCDLVLKGAGAALHSPEIAEAKKHGIPVRMSADLFAQFASIPIVGVTGTRGKSTTTQLIAHTLRTAGRSVLLGGNVRGVSTLALLPEVTPDSVAVLELDSWQLQGFGEAKLSPSIAIFTTLYPDHLNYYGGDMGAYLNDKAQIFLNQKSGDTLVIGEQCEKIVQETYEGKIPGHAVVAYGEDVPSDWNLKIPGEHNRDNAACALFALRVFGLSEEDIKKGFETFTGVEGRLQFVREVGGVKIYNDTTATTPDATIAGLRALDPEDKKNIVLIMGGADKQLDMSALIEEIPQHCKEVILLAGTGTTRLAESSEWLAGKTQYASLKDAFDAARASAQAGDIILLSPAFASFGMFKNEYDRGDQFIQLVQVLS